MTTDSQSKLSISLSHLLQELLTSINAIIGYSEMIVEDVEGIDKEVEYIYELEQIRECGAKLRTSINIFLNPATSVNSVHNLLEIISHPELEIELEELTQLLISNCQQLISLLEQDFISDLEEINISAHRIEKEILHLVRINLQETDSNYQEVSPEKALVKPSELDIEFDTEPVLAANLNFETSDYTILIVDDSPTNLYFLSGQVEAQGYQVATATDGKQGIEMIQTGAYDLILLDIIMPELNGYEVLKWINTSSWRHIPTIMISALDEIDSVVKCIEMGAADYLAKPFKPTLLKARLGACLEQKRLRDQESSYLEQLATANEKISKLNNCLQAENMRLSTELEITQRLQTMLLPKEIELSLIEGLEIAGFMEPADEVGGDYYDVLQHHGHTTIGIGDVTGHGLESGVLMLMVQTAVRTLMENNETDPKKFFEVLNRTIYKNIQRMNSDKNLSLCLVDYHEGVLSLSGQHEELIVVRVGGKIERIDTIDLGFPIGLEETIEDFVFQAQIHLNPGEVAVLYTDGITEAENHLGVHYGLEQLCTIVQQNWQQSAENIRQAVIQDLRSHIGRGKVYDDITLIILKQK